MIICVMSNIVYRSVKERLEREKKFIIEGIVRKLLE